MIIGSKNLKTHKIINRFRKKNNSNKIIINIFGHLHLTSNNKLRIINI